MGMRITVYDKDRKYVGQVGVPLSLTVTPREFPLIGTASMSVSLEDKQFASLRAEGARVVFEKDGDHLLSGPVDEVTIDTESNAMDITVLDDAWILRGILGWQVPGSPINSQGGAEYRTYSGKAETVVKQIVRENGVNRLRIPGLVVAPDQGRGADVPGGASFRMHPLPDRLYPGVEMAGIGLRVRQMGAELVFDVHVPRTYPNTLSVEGRTIKKAVHTRRRPQASRAVIGGSGEGKARQFRAITDTQREASHGFCGETFRDARDVNPEELPGGAAEADTVMDARGWETLAENGVVDGLSITLAESSAFTYGSKGVLVGDRVPVRVRGQVITDIVREAVIEWITPDYARATPVIGEQVSPEVRQAKTLAALKESQRKEERA